MPNRWCFVAVAGAFALLAACLNFGDLSGADDAGVNTDAGASACSASQKQCVGACVEQTDPSVGCSGACNACSSPPNVEPACALQNNTEVCSSGQCNAQYGDCDTQAANGCETHTTTSANCGSCGNSCGSRFCELQGASYTCSATCDAPNVVCATDAGAECVAAGSDTDNCGACGVSCVVSNGSGTCVKGSCALQCDPGYFACGGACILPSDHSCGASCGPCAISQTCNTQVGSTAYGTCTGGIAPPVCDAGMCKSSDGTCTSDLSQDPNCGQCGVSCAPLGRKCCGGSASSGKGYVCTVVSAEGGISIGCP